MSAVVTARSRDAKLRPLRSIPRSFKRGHPTPPRSRQQPAPNGRAGSGKACPMPLYKVGRPAHRVKKSYRLIGQEVFPHGTIALIERNRKCQEIDETAYAVVGTRRTLLLTSSALNPLPAADRSGRFSVPMRHPSAWFSNVEAARSIYGELVRRRKIPTPRDVRNSASKRARRRYEGDHAPTTGWLISPTGDRAAAIGDLRTGPEIESRLAGSSPANAPAFGSAAPLEPTSQPPPMPAANDLLGGPSNA